VLQGEFSKRGQYDWAVLCLEEDGATHRQTSTILIYRHGSAGEPERLAPMDETITPSKNAYYRILRVVGKQFIRRHYQPGLSAKPPSVIDHDGIDDEMFEKGSSVHYFYGGTWSELAGSD
jgi:hypothetical protein